jgi:hypothetical protein
MKTSEESIIESTRQISRLYYDGVNVKKAIEVMRYRGIIADLIESIYNQLSCSDERLKIEKFDYYAIEVDIKRSFDVFVYWTSRYLLAYKTRVFNRTFHEITIIDLFNDISV